MAVNTSQMANGEENKEIIVKTKAEYEKKVDKDCLKNRIFCNW